MTPKEQYEARKAERKARREGRGGYRSSEDDEATQEDFLNLLDRFVTATERIADALDTNAEQ